MEHWQEFWDSFKSAIHDSPWLAKVDKFKYLRSYLDEPAKKVIGGLSLTDADYDSAVQILKNRYARPAQIKRAHMSQLINLPAVYNEKNITKLQQLHDDIETNFRSLEALGVDHDSYSSIIVPTLLEKIPESIRLAMFRFGADQLDMDVKELLKSFARELDIRERHAPIFNGNNQNMHQQRGERPRQYSQMERASTASAMMVERAKSKKCHFCLEDHVAEDCKKFRTPEERKAVLMKFSRCFICLNKGHRSFQCRSRASCKHCNGKHHFLLCQDKTPPSKAPQPSDATPSLNPNTASCTSLLGLDSAKSRAGTHERVALQTAIAAVEGKVGSRVRVMFDSGSQKTFVTESVVKSLGLKVLREEELGVKTFGSREAEIEMRMVYAIPLVPVNGGKSITIEAFSVNEISTIANQHVEDIKNVYSHLTDIQFSDFSRVDDFLEIDILIGANYMWNFQDGDVKRGGQDEPVAIHTELGWVLSGPFQGKNSDVSSDENLVALVIEPCPLQDKTVAEINKSMHKLWDLETLGIRIEDEVHKSVVSKISFTGERYSVGLPWKMGHRPIPNNYENACVRLKSQVRKLAKTPAVLEEYNNIIVEQEKAGIIERVADTNTISKVSYLPHRAVVRNDAETTKVRIVYDASCFDRRTGSSLNDCLHVGPSLTPLMFDMLIRFREKPIVLVGDIEKAFLNIEIDPSDRDCLRFLWVNNIYSEQPEIMTYKFNRVVFGVNSSPFLLNTVLQFHVNRYKEADPKFVECMSKGFLVDDLVTTHKDVNEAFCMFEKARERMREGGFKLRKWKTNDQLLAQSIAIKETSLETESKIQGPVMEKSDPISAKTKVLGLAWDKEKDSVEFDLLKIVEGIKSVTKRSILGTMAAVFDPLGLICPISVAAKVLFQDLCMEKLGWDDPLPQDKLQRWEEWLKGLKNTKVITAPRYILQGLEGQIIKTSLHGFCDASKKAYCAAIYLVCETTRGIYPRLLCSKVRIAPLKSLSIPRLELMAARILVNLMDTTQKALSLDTEIGETKYWTDSITVLYWILNKGEWKTFIQHRVNEILALSRKEAWGHVAGLVNPADVGSRGVSPNQLIDSNLWWVGPKWLAEGKDNWPKKFLLTESADVKEEMKKSVVLASTTARESVNTIGQAIDIERFSSLGKLLRVTAYVKRFVVNLRRKLEKREIKVDPLSAEDIKCAEIEWIKDAQTTLRGQQDYNKYKKQLGVVSNGGILVCEGRMDFSDLAQAAKKPTLLPKNHKFSELVIMECHERVHHCKERSTLAELRSRFWITKGRQYVKRVINSCLVCRRFKGKCYNAPPAPPLPRYRVTEAPPFSRIGVDFAGPLFCKESKGKTAKVYVVLYTCCVTRAVHLDLVNSLDAARFLNSFRRFASQRGTPDLVVSDNAKTFKSTAKLLRQLYNNDHVANFMRSRRISWRFNLPRCPWAGGLFERLVRSVKRCLRKVLGNARLNFDELHTVLREIEATLNSRPLTYQYETDEVLTPSHLIFGYRLSPFAFGINPDAGNSEVDQTTLSKRFLFLRNKLLHFWKRWKSEYLTDLREHHCLTNKGSNVISEGDVVLVQDDQLKRGQWRIGIIEGLIVGKDGHVRGVNLRVSSTGKPQFCSRPVQKVYPLEISLVRENDGQGMEKAGMEGNVNSEKVEEEKENGKGKEYRPKRAAASDAQWKTKLMLDHA